jgi:hypothetical protein
LKNLLQQPWFYGDISGDEASDIIASCLIREGGAKKVKGKFRRFLVRFSANTAEGDKDQKGISSTLVK